MSKKTLTVRATDKPVPREGSRERPITATPVTVPSTPYYRRRISAGELEEVSDGV